MAKPGRIFEGNREVFLTVMGNEIIASDFEKHGDEITSTRVGASDLFRLARGESLEISSTGSLEDSPLDPPEILKVVLRQLEPKPDKPPKPLTPDPLSFSRHILYDGDVEAILDKHRVQFTHLHAGDCPEAHYQFSVSVRHRGKKFDWDPDVHDYVGSG